MENMDNNLGYDNTYKNLFNYIDACIAGASYIGFVELPIAEQTRIARACYMLSPDEVQHEAVVENDYFGSFTVRLMYDISSESLRKAVLIYMCRFIEDIWDQRISLVRESDNNNHQQDYEEE